jgi:hypothetical protein
MTSEQAKQFKGDGQRFAHTKLKLPGGGCWLGPPLQTSSAINRRGRCQGQATVGGQCNVDNDSTQSCHSCDDIVTTARTLMCR